jgi:hypothetical protein
VPSRPRQDPSISAAVADKVQAILASRGLTLYRASQQSIELYGRSSPNFLPHNLYYDLRRGGFTPSIHQVFALSQISGYRLSDWLRVFGINLEQISQLQAIIQSKRTILIDTSLVDSHARVQWFRNRRSDRSTPSIAPLAQLLEPGELKKISSLPGDKRQGYLYAKIGTEDCFACPDLLAGSVVRINPKILAMCFPTMNEKISQHIFLLEHSKGLFCSRLRRVQGNVIVPVGMELAFAQIELQFPSQVRLVGVVDLEIRSLLKGVQPVVPEDLAKRWTPESISREQSLGKILNRARAESNLSFREAAAISRMVSDALGDSRYSISPSSLCDYEVQGLPPRDLHKVVTLCCLYGLHFRTFLNAITIAMDKAGSEAMPENFFHTTLVATRKTCQVDDGEDSPSGFLGHLLELCGEIPFFLRDVIASFGALGQVSIDDFFWIGGEQDVLNPYLANGLLALVHRRRKTPFHFASKPIWEQPVYLLLERDGKYLCACCGLENATLVIHPYGERFHRVVQFRHHRDIEVVGQIMAIARRLT